GLQGRRARAGRRRGRRPVVSLHAGAQRLRPEARRCAGRTGTPRRAFGPGRIRGTQVPTTRRGRNMSDIIESGAATSQRDDSLRTIGNISYALHAIVAVSAVIPGVQASIAL